jgi:hypothetical protein
MPRCPKGGPEKLPVGSNPTASAIAPRERCPPLLRRVAPGEGIINLSRGDLGDHDSTSVHVGGALFA